MVSLLLIYPLNHRELCTECGLVISCVHCGTIYALWRGVFFTPTDVNVAFQQAMIKVAMDHEELTKLFQLTVVSAAADRGKGSFKARKRQSAWKYVGMVHTVSWPLHVVFTPAALEK